MSVPICDTKVLERRLLSVKEVAHILNKHPEIVRRMIMSGELKAIRRKSLHEPHRVDIREVERWIDKNNVIRPMPRRWQ